jgi:hypothetical protein
MLKGKKFRDKQQVQLKAGIERGLKDAGRQTSAKTGLMRPFSRNINLRYLLAKGKIKKLVLHPYLTSDQVAKLKYEYLDDTYVHHVVHEDTVGYTPDGRLAFIYLKNVVPEADIRRAERGLKKMKWYNTKQSHRKALRSSGGFELQFGWSDGFGRIRQFVPTQKQKNQYVQTWPLLDRMDGIFARVLPQIWGGQLKNQRDTNFARVATRVSSFSSVTCLKNAPSSIHLDSKNADAGLTVLTTAGKYTGGEFLFVQYGESIPIKRGDILIAATHREWHANFKMIRGVRYSIIGYFREGLRGAPPQKKRGRRRIETI